MSFRNAHPRPGWRRTKLFMGVSASVAASCLGLYCVQSLLRYFNDADKAASRTLLDNLRANPSLSHVLLRSMVFHVLSAPPNTAFGSPLFISSTSNDDATLMTWLNTIHIEGMSRSDILTLAFCHSLHLCGGPKLRFPIKGRTNPISVRRLSFSPLTWSTETLKQTCLKGGWSPCEMAALISLSCPPIGTTYFRSLLNVDTVKAHEVLEESLVSHPLFRSNVEQMSQDSGAIADALRFALARILTPS